MVYRPVLGMIRKIEGRFAILFVTLLAALMVPSFLPVGTLARVAVTVFTSLALVAGLLAVSRDRRSRTAGLALAIPAIAFSWLGRWTGNLELALIGTGLASLFFTYLTVLTVLFVGRSKSVTLNILFGAACA